MDSGRAMDQAVKCRPLTEEAAVRFQVIPCEVYEDKMTVGDRWVCLPLSVSFLQMIHCYQKDERAKLGNFQSSALQDTG